MKLINRHTLAARKVELWMRQYGQKPEMTDLKERLLELGDNPNPEIVDKMVGSDYGLEMPPCCECKQEKEEVIMFIPVYKYSNPIDTVYVCAECLLKAMMLINP